MEVSVRALSSHMESDEPQFSVCTIANIQTLFATSVPQPRPLSVLIHPRICPSDGTCPLSMRGEEHIHCTSHLSDIAPTLVDHLQPWCQGPSRLQSLTNNQHKPFTQEILGSAHDCMKPEGRMFLPWLELSSPGHPSFAFISVTLPKRVELQGVSSPLCHPSVTFPDVLFKLLSSPMPAAVLTEVIFCQRYAAYCER